MFEVRNLGIVKYGAHVSYIYIYIVQFLRFKVHQLFAGYLMPNPCTGEIRKFTFYKDGVQSQVESYQWHKKWYLMLPCITLNIIRYRSNVSGTIQGKE